jgi:hypothetical protein
VKKGLEIGCYFLKGLKKGFEKPEEKKGKKPYPTLDL